MTEHSKRQDLLNQDLIKYNPKRWRLNIPLRDYNLRVEDMVPALSGVIGKSALVAAFAIAWAQGLGISDPAFVTENVRLELFIASILAILFCAYLNPYAGPPGTLAPLIPIIPIMVASGVHPFPLSISIGILGLLISFFKYFRKIVEINQNGTKGGIILLFGFLGINSSLGSLSSWANNNNTPEILFILLLAALILYLVLSRFNLKWLVIPGCAAIALAISASFNLYPSFNTETSLPIINPSYWWNDLWGIGWGINPENFIKAFPFVVLALVMWPLDALAVRTIQEANYPKEANNAIFNMNTTYIVVSIRNTIGALLGGAQIAAVWRSFMIPLGVVRRPIGGSALLLGVTGISFALLGFPLDIAVFPPLLWLVLIFGVYIPLLEVGLNTIRSAATAQIAAICLVAGIALNPVLGWVIAIFIENFRVIKDPENDTIMSTSNKRLTLIIVAITIISYFVANNLS